MTITQLKGFRPLSGYIGLYRYMADINVRASKAFPSPLEVDRFISKNVGLFGAWFYGFPSPLEVDRFISKQLKNGTSKTENSFRPLSRWIGLYHKMK